MSTFPTIKRFFGTDRSIHKTKSPCIGCPCDAGGSFMYVALNCLITPILIEVDDSIRSELPKETH